MPSKSPCKAILFLSRQAICTIASYPACRSRAATATFDMCAVAPDASVALMASHESPMIRAWSRTACGSALSGERSSAVTAKCPARRTRSSREPDLIQPTQPVRLVTFGLMSLIHDEVPSSRRSVGVRTS